MKKSKTLSERLKSYSLFTTAVLASTAAANGQVIYTDVDPDISVGCDGGCATALDLNNDGITDYTLYAFFSESSFGSQSFNYAFAFPLPGNSISSASGLPLACDYGFEINSDLAWIDGVGVLGFYHELIFNTALYGNFLGESEKYLALRFSFNGEQHYGWARLSIGGDVSFVTLHDYAYEATPNQAIIAGDMGVATCPVPTNLSITSITSSSAKLKWDAVAGAEGYTVRYKVSNTSQWKYGTTYNTSKPISGLLPNTVYKWEVRTYCQIAPPYSTSDWSSKQDFTTTSLRMDDESLQQVSFQIYPNPAEGRATIQFTLSQSTGISIKVYDVSGKEIATLQDENVEQGEHSLQLDTNHFSKGVYLVKMISDFGIENQKLIVQ